MTNELILYKDSVFSIVNHKLSSLDKHTSWLQNLCITNLKGFLNTSLCTKFFSLLMVWDTILLNFIVGEIKSLSLAGLLSLVSCL